jgi:hypothetical protein
MQTPDHPAGEARLIAHHFLGRQVQSFLRLHQFSAFGAIDAFRRDKLHIHDGTVPGDLVLYPGDP